MLFVVDGQHAVGHRRAGIQGNARQTRGHGIADVPEMRCLPLDHHSQRHDSVMGPGQGLRHDRDLDGTQHPHHGGAVDARFGGHPLRPREQRCADLVMPGAGHDRQADT
ncbi:Uncharacterised protein [Mycobacteroides abscessus subsp. massiliense]|nr:Uncharacterised protein [Mycobacteroides abscessus subsp. massiliense]